MRTLLLLTGVWLGLGMVSPVLGQSVLRDGQPDVARVPVRSAFTLRPQPGLEALAGEVAAVLELRSGARVEVGAAPPPGLLEAVPEGHIALARTPTGVRLVLGAVGGRSLGAEIEIAPGADEVDPRSIALAVESLNDAALDHAHADRRRMGGGEPTGAADAATSTEGGAPSARRSAMLRDEGALVPGGFSKPNFLEDIQLLTFARAYSGATTASTSLESGIGAGMGLCAVGHCLYLAAEMPLSTASAQDIRYRYPTFSSIFYSRPFRFGDFTPGASIGLLTRVGHFRNDMGLPGNGLDTDLGARGSVELAWAVHSRLDVIAEAGGDYALDRFLLSTGGSEVSRGDRWSPWMQASVRFRPY